MSQMINYEKAKKHLHQIQKICTPLTDVLEISGFLYRRVLSDGIEISLSNDETVLHCIYENNLTIGVDYAPFIKDVGLRLIFWPLKNNFKAQMMIGKHCGWHHGITLANGMNEYYAFSIVGDENPNTLNKIVNRSELLERFCAYFDEKAAQIKTDLSQYQTSTTEIPTQYETPRNHLDNAIKNKFIEATPLKFLSSFTGDESLSNQKLTPTEVEVIRQLLHGYTNSELAELRNCSTRTIEFHIENLKDKFAVNSRGKLIQRLFDLGITKFFL